MPTERYAETWSKDRFSPMARDTPCLQGKIADPRSRDGNNKILHKRFPGGHLTIVGANAPSGLASRPIRLLLCDEVDRYPFSAGAEGDPVNLAKKRTVTFWNRKIVLVSTPTNKGRQVPAQRFCGLRESQGNSCPAATSVLSGSTSPVGCPESGRGSHCARSCASRPVHGKRRRSCRQHRSPSSVAAQPLRLSAANRPDHAFEETRLGPCWSWSSGSPCGSWLKSPNSTSTIHLDGHLRLHR